jgi:predicted AAA+ superfamily ATPase
MIPRFYDDLNKFVKPGKVLIIYGARQVGKTTLLKNFLSGTQYKYKLDSGDNISTQELLSSRDFTRILEYAEGCELIAIDEAQQIAGVGGGLKILVDQLPKLRVIVTGSSSFDLSQKVGEPLTGRKRTLTLYPVAQKELAATRNRHDLKEKAEDFLIFGSYPEVIKAATKKDKIEALIEIVNSYLFKDVFTLERIRGSKVLLDLVRLLALQTGSEVSLNELATQLGIDVKTAGRYLDILEKAFIILRLGGFSRNLRGEITSKCKYYFWDTGIRNAVISQFNPLNTRNDAGALWENFIIVERLKKQAYTQAHTQAYFWRTYSQKEIDLVEEKDGRLHGFECKWSGSKKASAPKEWRAAYPGSTFSVVSKENYLDFIT